MADAKACYRREPRDPHNVVALADGGFLIADASNQRVRRGTADGVITTLIGNGVRGYTGDGGRRRTHRSAFRRASTLQPPATF